METTTSGLGFKVSGYSPPSVDRIWAIWASHYSLPKAIFYLLKRDCRAEGVGHGTYG